LIIDGKKTDPRQVDSDIPQGSPVSPLLFLSYTSLLYKRIKKADVHVIGFVDDITIYTGSRDVDKNTEKLKNVLQVCHDWAQECHTEFDCGDKLGLMHINNLKRGRQSKKQKKKSRSFILLVVGLSRRQAQKSLKLLGVAIDYGIKFLEHARKVVSKAKKAVGIIGKLEEMYKGISSQTMRQLYVSCMRPVLEYASIARYHRPTGQWKEEMQKI
jgi:hypothetical protein